jgi:hypothetical protein
VHCTVVKDEPTSRAASISIDPAKLVLGALIAAGAEGEDMAERVEYALAYALSESIDDKDAFRLRLIGSLIEQQEKAAAAQLPRVPRQGETHVSGFVELLGFEETKDPPPHMKPEPSVRQVKAARHLNSASVARNDPELFEQLCQDWTDGAA